MKTLLVLPVIIPLATAALSFLFWRKVYLQRVLSVAGATALLVVAILLLAVVRSEGIQVMQMGGWSAPFGITFVADLFSAIMVARRGGDESGGDDQLDISY